MAKARILIVDDEPGVRDLLTDALSMSGYETVNAEDGLDALNQLRSAAVDLVIADINMPKLDGFGLIQHLRDRGDQTPVILLTARADRHDVTQGLRLGADDYLTKPFGLEELVLRVAAVLRRTMGGGHGSGGGPLEVGRFLMRDDQHTVSYDGQDLELSPTEYRLLQYLLERPGRVVSKTTLLADVWGMDFSTSTSVVDTYVSYLRKKLQPVGFNGLNTVRGVGVKLIVD